jgi:hypothetical protein
MCADLMGPTPHCRELMISPVDAFVVAQGTHLNTLPYTYAVLNQQAL